MSAYILIVDDDEDVRDVYQRLADYLQYPYRTATNGLEALAHIQQEIPGIMLLDMMMPKMTGYDLLDRLNNDASIPAFPIIVITAVPSDSLRDVPGITKIMTKTGYSVAELVNTIHEYYTNGSAS